MNVLPPSVLTVTFSEFGVRRVLDIASPNEYSSGPVPSAKDGVGCFVDLFGIGYRDVEVVTPWHPPGSTPPSAVNALAQAAYGFLHVPVRGVA